MLMIQILAYVFSPHHYGGWGAGEEHFRLNLGAEVSEEQRWFSGRDTVWTGEGRLQSRAGLLQPELGAYSQGPLASVFAIILTGL